MTAIAETFVLVKTTFVAGPLASGMQLIETLSDLGSDRLIVQANDGDTPRFVATAHSVLVLRGIVLGVMMVLGGPLLAHFFMIEHAALAFQLAAIAP